MASQLPTSETVARYEVNNSIYASGYTSAGLGAPPGDNVAVVTCMDARLDTYRSLGLDLGKAHVIRNAGGVITNDVIRSLALSQLELGTTEVLVIHHTKCGLAGLDEGAVLDRIAAKAGQRPSWRIHAFADVVEDTRQSVEVLRSNPFLLHTDRIVGYVHNVDTGKIEAI